MSGLKRPNTARSRRAGAKRAQVARVLGLADAWREWVAEALLAGVSVAQVQAVLVAEGVPARLAAREVDVIRGSLGPARRAVHQAARLALVARLKRTLATLDRPGLGSPFETAGDPGHRADSQHDDARGGGSSTGRAARTAAHVTSTIERRAELAPDEFYARYHATGRPVVLTRAIPDAAARSAFTPERLRARFADAEVEITDGRAADPSCDANFHAHVRNIRLGAFLDRIDAGDGQPVADCYLVARNRALSRPPLSELLAELPPLPAILDRDRLTGCVSLWLGPADTVTALHHDTTNILFCQLWGRKRLWLIAADEPAMLRDIRGGVYSPLSAESPDFDAHPHLREVTIHALDLAPGEAVFIPVGWWHQVRSLTPSASLAFTNFRCPNRFDWYLPGCLGELA